MVMLKPGKDNVKVTEADEGPDDNDEEGEKLAS